MISVSAYEFDNPHEAIHFAEADGGAAIRSGDLCGADGEKSGPFYVLSEEDAHRLAADGIVFGYVTEHLLPDGNFRIVTIPVN